MISNGDEYKYNNWREAKDTKFQRTGLAQEEQ